MAPMQKSRLHCIAADNLVQLASKDQISTNSLQWQLKVIQGHEML